MPATSYFITGTDTEVGKTVVTCAMLRAFVAKGARAVAMKPVASGCLVNADGGLDNEDVLAHAAAANVAAPRSLANPYAFLPPISPHLAAREAGVAIDMDHLVRCHGELRELADVVLVEGAGGWLAPLDESRTMADLAKAMNIPVVLVVGLRLGCLNHAMLTEEAILARGVRLAGWVANRVDPHMRNADDNLAYLQSHIAAPLLGVLPHHPGLHAAPQATVSIEAFRSEMLLDKGFGVDRLG